MKVKLVKVIFEDNHVYKYYPFNYCCEKLKRNPIILFSSEEETPSLYCENCNHCDELDSDECKHCKAYQCNDSDVPCFKMEKDIEESDYYDSYMIEYYLNINYCPHCGEKLEVEVADTIDCSQKYVELKNTREKLLEKCKNTDSKSEETDLFKQIRDLDNQINDFYEVGPVDKYLQMQNGKEM